jgi:hypothetical protein
MFCPKCGIPQPTEENNQCNNCGTIFSKIKISIWEATYAREAELWWQEPRNFSKFIEQEEYLKLAVFIIIASSFSYIWARRLSINPVHVVLFSFGIAILAVIALKLLDFISRKNIYMTSSEIVRARGRLQKKIQYQKIKECMFVQNNVGNSHYLDITTSDDKRRVIGIPELTEPTEIMAALKTHDVKCELVT